MPIPFQPEANPSVDGVSLYLLSSLLILMLIIAAFFSASETGMMALNRYRMRHLANNGHRGAILASTLLQRPDRLLGLILFGNNIVNFYGASIGVLIAVRLMGEAGYVLGPIALTFIFLIFAEAAPKTYAALRPEWIAFPASYVLKPLSVVCQPFVWAINKIANSLLAPFHLGQDAQQQTRLSREELRTVVAEATQQLSTHHRDMLLGILDLERATVEDIMVPRNEIVGIDLSEDLPEIIDSLGQSAHARLPLYRENLDNLVGVMRARRLPRLLRDADELSVEALEAAAEEPYFVPAGTPLSAQLLNFQRARKRRLALVVDEYGTLQGLVTMEDILEEIVGEFTTDATYNIDILKQNDGSFIIDGSATLREINRQLRWTLPTAGPKTLNGLILERLENIPEPGTSLRIDNFTLEITQVLDNAVKSVRVKLLSPADEDDNNE